MWDGIYQISGAVNRDRYQNHQVLMCAITDQYHKIYVCYAYMCAEDLTKKKNKIRYGYYYKRKKNPH